MASLVIIRGLPGSGKTTYAKQCFPNHIHLEADMFFVNANGDYSFYGSMIKNAHEWCTSTAHIFMNHQKDVIVSNTFTTLKEMRPYLDHAKLTGHQISVIRMNTQYGSIHDVPADVIERMKARFEPYDGEAIVHALSISGDQSS